MKTPTQELYEKLWETDKDRFAWNAILKEMLEKEKEVIMNAYNDGQLDMFLYCSAQDYYNETFNTKEK